MSEAERPNEGELILYQTQEGAVRIEVLYESQAFWLNQKKIAELFGVEPPSNPIYQSRLKNRWVDCFTRSGGRTCFPNAQIRDARSRQAHRNGRSRPTGSAPRVPGARLGGRLNGSPVDDLPGRRLLGVAERTKYLFGKESLSALYPAGTDEKRWVDGVLARKKGLGL